MKSSLSHNHLLRLLLGLLLLQSVRGEEEDSTRTCEAEGTCSAEAEAEASIPETPAPDQDDASQFEGVCDGLTNLYTHGGTAQAYKPGAPLSSYVCGSDVSNDLKYKVASWPFSRRSFRKGTAPKLDITLNIWSCDFSYDNNMCQCTDLGDVDAKNASSAVEVWQPRPDGQYSTLRPLEGSECRAQVPLDDDRKARFTTVAPGSTGSMSGLGPGGWECSPYGPPSIHILAKVAGHAPLLLDVPILVHPKTLEQKKFPMGDWRGAAWVRPKPKEIPFKISSWTPDVENNSISIEVDIFLQQSQEKVQLCQSWLYGLPTSFFLEPISMCGPSFLNFFSL
jgi:hypothetical protein